MVFKIRLINFNASLTLKLSDIWAFMEGVFCVFFSAFMENIMSFKIEREKQPSGHLVIHSKYYMQVQIKSTAQGLVNGRG